MTKNAPHPLLFLFLSTSLPVCYIPPWPVPFFPFCTLQSLTLKMRSKYLTPFLFFIFPWGLFVSFLSECQASAWVSKQTSSSRNDVSENCHRLGMSCQSLCWANDHCWVQWELKVCNSGHIFSSVRAVVPAMHVPLIFDMWFLASVCVDWSA